MEISNAVGLDSNILVYALDARSILYTKAKALVDGLLSNNFTVYIAPQNLNEAASVLTSKTKTSHAMLLSDVLKLIDELVVSFKLVFPDTNALTLHRNLMLKYDISGSRLYDNFLIATFLSHNIKTFYTNNPKDFVYYGEAKIVNPFA